METLPDVTAPAVNDPQSGVDIPAQVVDAGCVVRFEAPGGCLGAVTVTGVVVPPVTIPGTEVGGRTYREVVIAGATAPAVSAPQVCQITTEGGVAGVTRAGVVREGFSRDGGARPGDDKVSTVRVPPLRLPDVDIEPERLESRRLPDADVEVVTGETSTAYVAPAKVLFDTDRAELRPGAVGALRAIAEKIEEADPGARLLVEGHTDNVGSAAYGIDLSRRRAAAVTDVLVQQFGFDRSLISERGWGEENPAYTNSTAEGRQRNRRVVIMVLP